MSFQAHCPEKVGQVKKVLLLINLICIMFFGCSTFRFGFFWSGVCCVFKPYIIQCYFFSGFTSTFKITLSFRRRLKKIRWLIFLKKKIDSFQIVRRKCTLSLAILTCFVVHAKFCTIWGDILFIYLKYQLRGP